MIDIRHGYAIARKINGTYCIATKRTAHPSAPGSFSTSICLENGLEPMRRLKAELEEAGAVGLVLVRIVDDLITEVTGPAQ